MFDSSASTEGALAALAEQLAARNQRFELVVVGGAALLVLGLTERATRDVDIVAARVAGTLVDPRPLPGSLVEAAGRVAFDLALSADWLNAGPASQLETGLPKGFVDRLERRDYGGSLVIWFASRLDQIHLKLYAMVDQGPGKHETDLRALQPSSEEVLRAARWTITQDPSEGFRQELLAALDHLGVDGGDLVS